MKVRIVYDGACPFCDDYVRFADAVLEAGRRLALRILRVPRFPR